MIAHFISDYERHGAYTGFPSLGVEWQKMESPVLRQALGMQASGWLVWGCCLLDVWAVSGREGLWAFRQMLAGLEQGHVWNPKPQAATWWRWC